MYLVWVFLLLDKWSVRHYITDRIIHLNTFKPLVLLDRLDAVVWLVSF
jgi:hypothetical protein